MKNTTLLSNLIEGEIYSVTFNDYKGFKTIKIIKEPALYLNNEKSSYSPNPFNTSLKVKTFKYNFYSLKTNNFFSLFSHYHTDASREMKIERI